MRFLMLNWRDPANPLTGGAERVSLAYMSALAQRGHEVCWFAYDFPDAKPAETVDRINFVRGGGKGTSVLKAIQWYRKQTPFDLVIDQHHGIPWYAPWWTKTNCIAYIHEVLGPIWDSFYRWPLNVIGRWQERWTHWLYRRIQFWTPSECTKNILREHGVRSVQVFPNGVYTVALPRLDPKPLCPPLRLVTVSRLAPNKRIDHAVRTVKHLVDKGIRVRLTIVGVGEMESALCQLVSDLRLGDQVRFAGHLSEEEKDACLRDAHCLVHTSQREGWGLNVIEANAMGTPAVVYPVGGLVESTLHERTGLVAREETPESLAASLASLLGAPDAYETYRLNAWRRAQDLHWSKLLPVACDWLEKQAAGLKARVRSRN